MSFFNEDPFEDIVREFFGQGARGKRQQFIRGEEEDRTIDFVDDGKHVYVVFELPGFSERDVSVRVQGKELEIVARKQEGSGIQSYLAEKLERGLVIRKDLPDFVSAKKFSHSVRNGVLEVVFERK